MALAYVAARYGRRILTFIEVHGHPAAVGFLALLAAAAAVVFYFWRTSKGMKPTSGSGAPTR